MTAKKNWESVDPYESRKMPKRRGGPYRQKRYKSNYKPLHLRRDIGISFHVTLEEYLQIEKYCRIAGSRLARSTVIRRWVLEGLARENQS